VKAFARGGDFWSGLALAGLGAYILGQAGSWVYLGEDGPGAGFFPMWYGGAMVVLSLALVAGTFFRKPAQGEPEAYRWGDLGRAMTCWAAFVASIALMPLLGFTVSFALLIWFIVTVMARRPQRIALPVSIGGALLFYAIFALALDLSLPKGLAF
jgi:putative tricarboxylic transport membrane protein